MSGDLSSHVVADGRILLVAIFADWRTPGCAALSLCKRGSSAFDVFDPERSVGPWRNPWCLQRDRKRLCHLVPCTLVRHEQSNLSHETEVFEDHL